MQFDIVLWPTFVVLLLTALYLYSPGQLKSRETEPAALLKGKEVKVRVKVLQKNYDGDTLSVTFAFADENSVLGTKPGQGIQLYIEHSDGSTVSQTFYPISNCNLKGRLTIQDHPSNNSQYSDAISSALDAMEADDSVEISGPVGNLAYAGNLRIGFVKQGEQKSFSALSFIASGTNVFPVFQMIVHICEEGLKAPLSLLYYAETEEDFLLDDILTGLHEKKLIKLAKKTAEHFLNEDVLKEEVSAELIKETFPTETKDQLIILSGSASEQRSWTEALLSAGFEQKQICAY